MKTIIVKLLPKNLRVLLFVIISLLSVQLVEAQCTVTTTRNSSTLTCGTAPLSNCGGIVYIGDGTNAMTLTINNDLDLSCLGPIQLIIKNAATIYFQSSNRLYLAAGSNIIIEVGGNLDESSPCSASQRIYIGGDLISSCNGGAGADYSFPQIVANGGYSSINATASPSSVCVSGIFTLTATATPSSGATYKWYTLASGGSPIYTGNPYTTPTISTSTTYYVEASYTSPTYTTVRRVVTTTVNTLSVAPTEITGTTTICNGASTTLSVSGGTAGTGAVAQWFTSSCGGTLVGTGNSITVSPTSNTTYFVRYSGTCNTTNCASQLVIVNTTNTWTGANNNSNWNESNNWTCGVPAPNSNFIIPNVTNKPLLATDFTVNNIEIQSGALLNVNNNGLTITGTLTLNGKIDLQNESQLIQTSLSDLNPSCQNGVIEIDQQGTSNSFYFNYWGSPVYSICTNKNYSISGVLRDGTNPTILSINFLPSVYAADGNPTSPIILSTGWMYKFVNYKKDVTAGWVHIGKDGVLQPGGGFTMKGSNGPNTTEQNYTFVGKPNNGTIEYTIAKERQYLIGNPYPSALDAQEFIKDNLSTSNSGRNTNGNIIDGTLYFWDHLGGADNNGNDSHNSSNYVQGYATYTLSGGLPAGGLPPPGPLPPPPLSRKVPGRYIPVAQGFIVSGSTDADGGGMLQFKNSQRAFKKESVIGDNSTFIRNTGKATITKKQVEEKDLTQRIYLNYHSPMGYQRTLLAAFIPNTTNGIDIGYDAKNIDQFKEDIYWKVANTNLVIQAVPSILNSVLPLELKIFTKGNAKIRLDALENIPAEFDLFIKDNLTSILHNIRKTAFEINLSPGTYTNRFELVLQTQKTSTIEEEKSFENTVNIYFNNVDSKVYVNKTETIEIKEINLHNMIGQQLLLINKGLDSQSIEIPLSVQSGVYLVNIKTNNGTISKKVLKI